MVATVFTIFAPPPTAIKTSRWQRFSISTFGIGHSPFPNFIRQKLVGQPIMNPEFAIDLLKSMILQSLTLATPILLTAMVIGLAVSLFQAVTTIHEQTLAFVPKALAVVGICLLLMPWIVRSLIDFTTAVFLKMPQMVN